MRLWDQQVAAAYRQSFDAFTAAHPDIEVRINIVSYATYFDTLRTDVAGGSADDIFWINNSNFAAYADSGRLMAIEAFRRLGGHRWSTSSPATERCGACHNSATPASRCTTTRTCCPRPA